jgi:hypothetical protein
MVWYFPNDMKNFFYSHPDTVIAGLAAIFLGILLGFYLWAINDIFSEVHRALTFSPPQSSNSFDLAGAAKLDWRGLVNGSSSSPATTTESVP